LDAADTGALVGGTKVSKFREEASHLFRLANIAENFGFVFIARQVEGGNVGYVFVVSLPDAFLGDCGDLCLCLSESLLAFLDRLWESEGLSKGKNKGIDLGLLVVTSAANAK
jgi:hypothetical protein